MKMTSLSGRKHSHGAALVEYGMLIGLVAVVAIGAVSGLGGQVDGTFTTVTSDLSGVLAADASAQDEGGTVFGPRSSGLAYTHDGYFARLANATEAAHFDALCAEFDPSVSTYVNHTQQIRDVDRDAADAGLLHFNGSVWAREPGVWLSSPQDVVTSLTCR